jgi:hypothetical protein
VAKLPPRVFVENLSNVFHERVDAKINNGVPFVQIGSVEDIVNRLRGFPFADHKADSQKAKVAADVYTWEIAEYERSGRNGYKPCKLADRIVILTFQF